MTAQILDLRSLRRRNPERFDLVWREFRPIYSAEFPDPSEREDETTWLRWLGEDDPPPQPLYDLSIAIDPANSRVIGGAGYEYYRGSRCGLLTYLVVRPDERRRGVGRALVLHVVKRLRSMATDAGATLAASFTEAQDPALVDAARRETAERRLAIYSRLGALRLDLPYVQPALAPGLSPARHMKLLALDGGAEASSLSADVVLDFLREYYRALEIANPDEDPDFRRTRDAAGTMIRLLAANEGGGYIPSATR